MALMLCHVLAILSKQARTTLKITGICVYLYICILLQENTHFQLIETGAIAINLYFYINHS